MTNAAGVLGAVGLDFWILVAITAGIYGIFTLGLQLNVGLTGIFNFGQAGFMAVGAYTMAILVTKAQWSFWLALPAATALTMAVGILVGMSALRLRADYLAIATIAFGEIVRYVAQNARGLTGGNQGLSGYDEQWFDVSDSAQSALGLGPDFYQVPLLIVTWAVFLVLVLVLTWLKGSPWGRVLRAIREDEDAVRALGKNPFPYKLQSLSIAAGLGSVAGYLLALSLASLSPSSFVSSFTFFGYTMLILGGLGSFPGVILGAVAIEVLMEGTRNIDLPMSADKVAGLRFVIVGLVLMVLISLRPRGVFGKQEEMVLGE